MPIDKPAEETLMPRRAELPPGPMTFAREIPATGLQLLLDDLPLPAVAERYRDKIFRCSSDAFAVLVDGPASAERCWYIIPTRTFDHLTGLVLGYREPVRADRGNQRAAALEYADTVRIFADLLESVQPPQPDSRSVVELRGFAATTAAGRAAELTALPPDSEVIAFRDQLPHGWTGHQLHPLLPADSGAGPERGADPVGLELMSAYYLATNVADGQGVNFADIPDLHTVCMDAVADAEMVFSLEYRSPIDGMKVGDDHTQCIQITGPSGALTELPPGVFATAFVPDTKTYCDLLARHGFEYAVSEQLEPPVTGQEFYLLMPERPLRCVVKPQKPVGPDPLAPLRRLGDARLNSILDRALGVSPPGLWEDKVLSRAAVHDLLRQPIPLPLRHYLQEAADSFGFDMYWLEDWKNGVLSNFSGHHALLIDGANQPPGTHIGTPPCSYPTLEHAYQAAKFADPEIRRRIANAPAPVEAKAIARDPHNADKVVPEWDEIKALVMWRLLLIKFSHPELRELLLSTGERQLIEGTLRTDAKGNPWNDGIWGLDATAHGWNSAGRLLMLVRAQLRGQVPLLG